MKKPVIGISGSEVTIQAGPFMGEPRTYVNAAYVDSVYKNGGIPLVIPFTKGGEEMALEQMKLVDCLILSGGHDVDPHLYGEEIDQKSGATWPDRDQFDIALLAMIGQICRSNQCLPLVYRDYFRVQGCHFIFILVVVIYLQKPAFVSQNLIKIRLLVQVIDKKFDEHAPLALLNDDIDQFRKIRRQGVSCNQDVPFCAIDHRLHNIHGCSCVNRK